MADYHYIIVVHGMGESEYGQTILPVVSRCAEVIDSVWHPDKKDSNGESPYDKAGRDIVTLGAFVGASPNEKADRPWVEFRGIASAPDHEEPFTGLTTHNKAGKLIRFSEIWWKELLDKHDHVLEPASPWADGLIGRIERMNAQPPNWMFQLLFKLQDVLGPLQTILKTRKPDVEELAFNKYLGDVQIYAEYEPMRGMAVRRFHDRMEEIFKAHVANLPAGVSPEEAPPRFTILAHSLGTIMSLDALMYAHLADPKNPNTTLPNFPFPGYYDEKAEKAEGEDEKSGEQQAKQESNAAPQASSAEWIKYVDNFVTLGSPIDKFLLFWPHNYTYLEDDRWIAPDKSKPPRIRHINYCDQQDPVGQALETLQSTKVYQKLFTASYGEEKKNEEKKIGKQTAIQKLSSRVQNIIRLDTKPDEGREFDVVYQRSLWPGLAHTSYWKDKDLFRNILEQVLKKEKVVKSKVDNLERPNVVGDKRGMYIKIALLTYFVIPLVIITLDVMVYDMLLEPKSWKRYFFVAALFVGICWVSRELINLLVWWRQLLRNKRNREIVSRSTTSIFVKWIVRLGLPLLALGFAQVAITTSGPYVNSIKTQIKNADGTYPVDTRPITDSDTPFESIGVDEFFYVLEKMPEPVQVLVSPFKLIGGHATSVRAFWVALMTLFFALVLYRRKFSNYKESIRYEKNFSIYVDLIIFLFGYGLLLLLWQGDTTKSLIAGAPLIWMHTTGIILLGILVAWHIVKFRNDSKAAKKDPKIKPFRTADYIVSFIVLFVGWMLIEKLSSGSSAWFLRLWETDDIITISRVTYFGFIGTIIWLYMALRFFVAKLQLGKDQVSEFAEYAAAIIEQTQKQGAPKTSNTP